MATQECRICGTEKPLSEFHFRNDNQKYRTNCKVCRNKGEVARRYNITVEQLDQLIAKQNNRCAICGIHADDVVHATFSFSPLVIDHDHSTGKVRGLLCPNCNCGVGHFKNDAALLDKASQYLQANG